jgi:hypothetical protein
MPPRRSLCCRVDIVGSHSVRVVIITIAVVFIEHNPLHHSLVEKVYHKPQYRQSEVILSQQFHDLLEECCVLQARWLLHLDAIKFGCSSLGQHWVTEVCYEAEYFDPDRILFCDDGRSAAGRFLYMSFVTIVSDLVASLLIVSKMVSRRRIRNLPGRVWKSHWASRSPLNCPGRLLQPPSPLAPGCPDRVYSVTLIQEQRTLCLVPT